MVSERCWRRMTPARHRRSSRRCRGCPTQPGPRCTNGELGSGRVEHGLGLRRRWYRCVWRPRRCSVAREGSQGSSSRPVVRPRGGGRQTWPTPRCRASSTRAPGRSASEEGARGRRAARRTPWPRLRRGARRFRPGQRARARIGAPASSWPHSSPLSTTLRNRRSREPRRYGTTEVRNHASTLLRRCSRIGNWIVAGRTRGEALLGFPVQGPLASCLDREARCVCRVVERGDLAQRAEDG